MLFTQDAMAGIVDGSITLTFRRWLRPQAAVGSRHRVRGEMIEIDEVCTVDADDITDAEATSAGAASADQLRERLARRSDLPIWRVAFHHIGPDDRLQRRAARLDDNMRAQIQQRLDRMDRAGTNGPWTAKTLRLIAMYPGVVSTALARRLGHDRAAFKTNVRKLKELGLTESLDVGYRLSALGRAFTGDAANDPPEG